MTDAGLEAWERSRVVNGLSACPAGETDLRGLGAVTTGLLEGHARDGDLRRLNLALKLRDLNPSRVRPSHDGPSGPAWESALEAAEGRVADALRRLAQAPAAGPDPAPAHGPTVPVAALCSRGSSTAALSLTGRRAVDRVACYDGTPVGHGPYASAWAPPDTVAEDPPPQVRPDDEPHDWDAVASWFDGLAADLPVIVVGMPVLPAGVLKRARGAVFNAHNGRLPGVRGLDSLAWALATGIVPTATAHRVVAAVDAGEVRARVLVDPFPTATLRRRMKAAQVTALEAALSPAPAPADADAPSAYYGRMHTALRHLLSAVLGRRSSHP